MTDAATSTDAPAAMFLIIPVGKKEPETALGEEEFLDCVLDDARVHKTMTVTAVKLVERVKNHAHPGQTPIAQVHDSFQKEHKLDSTCPGLNALCDILSEIDVTTVLEDDDSKTSLGDSVFLLECAVTRVDKDKDGNTVHTLFTVKQQGHVVCPLTKCYDTLHDIQGQHQKANGKVISVHKLIHHFKEFGTTNKLLINPQLAKKLLKDVAESTEPDLDQELQLVNPNMTKQAQQAAILAREMEQLGVTSDVNLTNGDQNNFYGNTVVHQANNPQQLQKIMDQLQSIRQQGQDIQRGQDNQTQNMNEFAKQQKTAISEMSDEVVEKVITATTGKKGLSHSASFGKDMDAASQGCT